MTLSQWISTRCSHSKESKAMISSERAQQLQSAEQARASAPDKFCPFCLAGQTMNGKPHKQVVKIGTICPACGKKVL